MSRRYDWTEDQIFKLDERVKKLESEKPLLARVADVRRGIDNDHPEWGLRALAEECEQAITRPLRSGETK
jgi:hypothetical protein